MKKNPSVLALLGEGERGLVYRKVGDKGEERKDRVQLHGVKSDVFTFSAACGYFETNIFKQPKQYY